MKSRTQFSFLLKRFLLSDKKKRQSNRRQLFLSEKSDRLGQASFQTKISDISKLLSSYNMRSVKTLLFLSLPRTTGRRPKNYITRGAKLSRGKMHKYLKVFYPKIVHFFSKKVLTLLSQCGIL